MKLFNAPFQPESIVPNIKQPMKRLTAMVLLVAALGCHKKVDPDCTEKPHDGRGCTFILRPVCGCNGKTYDNSCVAESVGITKYTQGECRKGK